MSTADFYQSAAGLVSRAGGRLYMVGGRVRDYFLFGRALDSRPGALEDVDLLVRGLDLPAILSALSKFGAGVLVGRRTTVSEVKEESIIHLRLEQNYLEISPARRRNHKGEIEISPEAGLLDDARTRDFRLNAIYYDPLSRKFEDPLGGIIDAEAGLLRLAHERAFEQDPLRMLRAMNFISRFKLRAEPEVLRAAGENVERLNLLPPDRFWPEWKKWALGLWPHLGLEYLYESGLINFWPSLAALAETPQNPRFHPEGNVWLHTVLVVKALSELELPPGCNRVLLTLAALLHDIGKPLVIEINDGVPMSRGHAQAGLPLAAEFLESIRAPGEFFKPLARLVERHMDMAFRELTPKALRRLARRLSPDCGLTEFWALTASDWNGRGRGFKQFPYSLEEFLAPLGGQDAPLESPLKGRDLLENFNLSPGPELGRILKMIEEATDDGLISGRDQALAYAATIIGPQAETRD